jgi:aryl-alcohol dehydrogenase-like predicted oxidoreductase
MSSLNCEFQTQSNPFFQIYWGKANSANPDKPLNNNGLSRKHIIEGMNLSLKRLDLPYVDIVYAHRPDRDTPMEEIVRGFNYLINTGKAFYWGTSEWTASEIAGAWRIADKLGLVGPVVEQPQYNLLVRERVEKEYRWLYEAHGLGLTIFSPLKGGVLTGKYNGTTEPPAGSRLAESEDGYIKGLRKTVGDDAWTKQLKQVEALKPIADELGISTAQLSLAWILKNPNISSMITGASRPEQVRDNVRALAVAEKLTDEVIEKIEAAIDTKPGVEIRRF